MAIVCQVYGYCLAIVWLLCEKCMAIVWLLYGHLKSTQVYKSMHYKFVTAWPGALGSLTMETLNTNIGKFGTCQHCVTNI